MATLARWCYRHRLWVILAWIAGLVGLLAVGNAAFHIEARLQGVADYSIRLGLAVVIVLAAQKLLEGRSNG